MDKAHLDQLRSIVQSHKDRFNCEVSESKLFGIMMAGYTDSSRFYLEAAGEALEDWNSHGAAALVRRIADASLSLNAALAANELLEVCKTLLSMVEANYGEADNDPDVLEAMAVIDCAEGKQEWKWYTSDAKDRAESIKAIMEKNKENA